MKKFIAGIMAVAIALSVIPAPGLEIVAKAAKKAYDVVELDREVYKKVYGETYAKGTMVAVNEDNKCGLINEKGKVVLGFKYDNIQRLSNSKRFLVNKGSTYYILNAKFKTVKTFKKMKYMYAGTDFIVGVRKNGNYVEYDFNGKKLKNNKVSNTIQMEIPGTECTLKFNKKKAKAMVCDEAGEVVYTYPYEVENVEVLGNGQIALVFYDEENGDDTVIIVDVEGNVAREHVGKSYVTAISSKLYVVKNYMSAALYTNEGTLIVDGAYYISKAGKYVAVSKGQESGIYKEDGTFVSDKYREVNQITKKYFSAYTLDYQEDVYYKKKLIVKDVDYILSYGKGSVLIYKGAKTYLYNKNGKLIKTFKNGSVWTNGDTLCFINSKGNEEYYNEQGKKMVELRSKETSACGIINDVLVTYRGDKIYIYSFK